MSRLVPNYKTNHLHHSPPVGIYLKQNQGAQLGKYHDDTMLAVVLKQPWPQKYAEREKKIRPHFLRT